MVSLKKIQPEVFPSLKSCFAFKVPNESPEQSPPKPFRDPFGSQILSEICSRLRAEGFQLSDPKPGRACDSGSTARCPGLKLEVVVLVKRSQTSIDCALLTWRTRPAWRRISSPSVLCQWEGLCAAIERILREDLKITPLLWLTREQAEAHWRKDQKLMPTTRNTEQTPTR